MFFFQCPERGGQTQDQDREPEQALLYQDQEKDLDQHSISEKLLTLWIIAFAPPHRPSTLPTPIFATP
jgi:hypothetical protein